MIRAAKATTPGSKSGGVRRVAYYLWQYPRLSETFVAREIDAVRCTGIDIQVIADSPERPAPSRPLSASGNEPIVYLYPLARRFFAWNLACWLLAHPVDCWTSLVNVRRQRYQARKSWWRDAVIFLKAVHLAGLLKKLDIDHLHCPWADVNSFIGLIAARLARISFSVQARAYEVHQAKAAFALQLKFEQARFVVTNSRFNERYLRSMLPPGDRHKLHVIYNGVPLPQLQPGSRPARPATLSLLSVGRLVPQKGFEYLLRACRLLLDEGYSLRCTIIGAPVVPDEEVYYRRLRRLQAGLGLADVVAFAGPQPFREIVAAYRACDIFTLPCVVVEGGACDIIPNVLIEAMAMRLPVVSTSINGIPELVAHGRNGLLVPPRDERALAGEIAALIDDPTRRRALAKQARQTVENRFDSFCNARAYAKLFRDAV